MLLTFKALLIYWMVMKMPEVQDIFAMHAKQYHHKHPLSPEKYKAMMDIINCRTLKLGGHIDECDECGNLQISYNSCRNRHCPKCQTFLKEKWIDARKEELLPVPYFHIVFTIPEELNMLIYQNQKKGYKLFFKAVSETLKELSEDPKHFGAKIGFVCLLHTWSQNMLYHPHLHVVLPFGGLTPDGKFKIGAEDFFIHVQVLSSMFKGKFLHMLEKAYSEGDLEFYGSMLEYEHDQLFQAYLNTLRKKDWVVYCKETFSGPEAVIEYLGRYTHRICISNNRILHYEDGSVTFKWKDYRDNKHKTMTITAEEFIRRFLMHILPSGLMKINYYGILSNRNKKTQLRQCQKELDYECAKSIFKDMTAVDIIKAITGTDITLCPCCKKGRLRTVRTVEPKSGSPPAMGEFNTKY
jgi:hypothetical protein